MKLSDFNHVTKIGSEEMFHYKNAETGDTEFFKYGQLRELSEVAFSLWKAECSIENYRRCVPIGEPVESKKLADFDQRIFSMRMQIEELQQGLEMVKDEYERSLLDD
jgi:hypothetical protein